MQMDTDNTHYMLHALHQHNRISHTVQADCSIYMSRYTRHLTALNLFTHQRCNSFFLFSPVHMTATSKRPTSRSASSPASSSSRARRCTTVQARQPLWPSTCTGPACSIPSRLLSRAWPRTTGPPPTSATPPPACRLLPAPSTATPRPSLPHRIQSPAFPTGLTKSACTTRVLLRALTDDGFSKCCHLEEE